MLTVRQKERPHVDGLTLAERGDCGGHSASGGHSLERRVSHRGKDDYAMSVPCSTARIRRIAQRNGRAARDLDLLEFPASKESNESAVGRPERLKCAFGSRQWLRGKRIQRTDPELQFAIRLWDYNG